MVVIVLYVELGIGHASTTKQGLQFLSPNYFLDIGKVPLLITSLEHLVQSKILSRPSYFGA